MNLKSKCAAEALGTAWIVFAGCGAGALSGSLSNSIVVALAFGLSLSGAIFALGHVSGGHFNPAVSIGLSAAGRLPRRNLPAYLVSQILGACLGAGLVALIATGKPGLEGALASVSNGYGDHSPSGFGLLAALTLEYVLTFFLVMVVLGSTDGRAPKGFAPLAIGLTLIAIHLVGIPVTNLSVNPARSTGPALWVGGWALLELWVFWLSPLLGAYTAGKLYRIIAKPRLS